LACAVGWLTLHTSHGGGNDGSEDAHICSEGGTNAQAAGERRQRSGNAQTPGDRSQSGSDTQKE
jgi:hypothetical protein